MLSWLGILLQVHQQITVSRKQEEHSVTSHGVPDPYALQGCYRAGQPRFHSTPQTNMSFTLPQCGPEVARLAASQPLLLAGPLVAGPVRAPVSAPWYGGRLQGDTDQLAVHFRSHLPGEVLCMARIEGGGDRRGRLDRPLGMVGWVRRVRGARAASSLQNSVFLDTASSKCICCCSSSNVTCSLLLCTCSPPCRAPPSRVGSPHSQSHGP